MPIGRPSDEPPFRIARRAVDLGVRDLAAARAFYAIASGSSSVTRWRTRSICAGAEVLVRESTAFAGVSLHDPVLVRFVAR
jgi:hypothetical protein